MTNKLLTNGAATIQRAIVFDGLRSLCFAHRRLGRLTEGSHACGYREGFEDALQAVAHLIGASSEFDKFRADLKGKEGTSKRRMIYPWK